MEARLAATSNVQYEGLAFDGVKVDPPERDGTAMVGADVSNGRNARRRELNARIVHIWFRRRFRRSNGSNARGYCGQRSCKPNDGSRLNAAALGVG